MSSLLLIACLVFLMQPFGSFTATEPNTGGHCTVKTQGCLFESNYFIRDAAVFTLVSVFLLPSSGDIFAHLFPVLTGFQTRFNNGAQIFVFWKWRMIMMFNWNKWKLKDVLNKSHKTAIKKVPFPVITEGFFNNPGESQRFCQSEKVNNFPTRGHLWLGVFFPKGRTELL